VPQIANPNVRSHLISMLLFAVRAMIVSHPLLPIASLPMAVTGGPLAWARLAPPMPMCSARK
jgi:hypothetical protein